MAKECRQIEHRQLAQMGEAEHTLTVFVMPTTDEKKKWRLEIHDLVHGVFTVQTFRGRERKWSQLNNATDYVFATLPKVRSVVICR